MKSGFDGCGMFCGSRICLLHQLVRGKDKDDWLYYMLPAYEVTVTVTVEHDGRTFVYSRTYLPEYEECEVRGLKHVYDNAKKADKTHYTDLFDSQIDHIQSIREWLARTIA